MFLKQIILSAIFVVLTASPAWAVPCKQLCDVSQEVTKLQKNVTQALVQISGLTEKLATSQNTADLKNLLLFCAQAKPIILAAKLDTNVINAVGTLEKIANLGLSKYVEDIQADLIFGYFSKLPDFDEASRLDVIQTWSGRIPKVENREDLGELATFFSKAGDWCDQNEDSIFVVKAARDSEQSVITKIFQLNPFFEGAYSASITCDDRESENCPTDLFDRIVILDTYSLTHIQLAAINTKLGVSVFNFTQINVSHAGKTFDSLSTTNSASALAQLHIDYDPDSNSWSGTIESTDQTFHIHADPLENGLFVRLFDNQAATPLTTPLTSELFDNLWQGSFGSVGNAILKTSLYQESTPTDVEQREIGATLRFASVVGYKLDFQWGRVFKKTGIVSMVASQADGGFLKMVLAAQPSDDGQTMTFQGISISSMNGVVNKVSFGVSK